MPNFLDLATDLAVILELVSSFTEETIFNVSLHLQKLRQGRCLKACLLDEYPMFSLCHQ